MSSRKPTSAVCLNCGQDLEDCRCSVCDPADRDDVTPWNGAPWDEGEQEFRA